MPRLIGLLDSRRLTVDTPIQGTRPEKGRLRSALIEDIDQLAGVLIWAIIVGESNDTGLGALSDDDAGFGGALDDANWVLDWDGGRGGGKGEGG